MRVRIEGYTVITKTLQTSYNIGVQANCKTKGVKTMAQKAHSLSHTKWMCKYHIVFTPKYRRKIIYNQYRSSLGEIFHRLCQYKGVEIIEGHLMPDHVHMLVSIPPRMSVASFMGTGWDWRTTPTPCRPSSPPMWPASAPPCCG